MATTEKREKYNLFPLASRNPGSRRILEFVEELQEGMIVTITFDGGRESTEDGSTLIGFPSGRTEKVRIHLQQPDPSKKNPNHGSRCVCENCHPWWVGYETEDPGIINTAPYPVTFQSSKPAQHVFDSNGYDSTQQCAVCGAWADEADTVECKPDIYILPPYRSGLIIYGRSVDEAAGTHPSGAELVRARFDASEYDKSKLDQIEKQNPGAIIVGSIIAAQAFPGRVYATIPAPGFERVPPAEKRMRDDKFLVF
jgi:hypothetical protein